MNHLSGNVSFLFSSGYFHIFSDAPADFSVLPRILFCIFSVRLQKIICCFFIRIIRFLRFFRFVGIIFPAFFMWSWENFLPVYIIFLLSWNFFERKIRFFFVSVIGFSGMSFLTIRIFFKFFSWGNWEIFLPVFIIFALFPGLFKGKILIFRNEFSVRTNIFSLPRGVFPDFFSCHPIKKTILPEYFSSHPAGIFTFPAHFCTNQTRANLRTRNNIEYPSRLPFPHSEKYVVKHTWDTAIYEFSCKKIEKKCG